MIEMAILTQHKRVGMISLNWHLHCQCRLTTSTTYTFPGLDSIITQSWKNSKYHNRGLPIQHQKPQAKIQKIIFVFWLASKLNITITQQSLRTPKGGKSLMHYLQDQVIEYTWVSWWTKIHFGNKKANLLPVEAIQEKQFVRKQTSKFDVFKFATWIEIDSNVSSRIFVCEHAS